MREYQTSPLEQAHLSSPKMLEAKAKSRPGNAGNRQRPLYQRLEVQEGLFGVRIRPAGLRETAERSSGTCGSAHPEWGTNPDGRDPSEGNRRPRFTERPSGGARSGDDGLAGGGGGPYVRRQVALRGCEGPSGQPPAGLPLAAAGWASRRGSGDSRSPSLTPCGIRRETG